VGNCLPSEKELQGMFNVSRTTVRLALKELEVDGRIVRYPGRGTFLTDKKMVTSARRLHGFTNEIATHGLKPVSKIISFEIEQATEKTLKMLQLESGNMIWKIDRIRYANDIPVATEICYIPASLAPNLNIDKDILKHGSLYQYLYQKHNIKIKTASERVEAKIADSTEMKQLRLTKGSPVLYVERLSYGSIKSDKSLLPIEFVKTIYNAEKYAFDYVLNDFNIT
jgi:GntR family transcriptional regulator